MTVLHLFGAALLLGAVLALDLRLLRGGASAVPAAALAAQLLPLAWAGFALTALTGAALFATAATAYAGSAIFLAKLAAIAAAGGNALLLDRAGGVAAPRRAAAIAAGASALLWSLALGLGRWIAYG